MGRQLGDDVHCRALIPTPNGGFTCGLVSDPYRFEQYAPDMRSWRRIDELEAGQGERALKAHYASALGAGRGCDSEDGLTLTMKMPRQDDHKLVAITLDGNQLILQQDTSTQVLLLPKGFPPVTGGRPGRDEDVELLSALVDFLDMPALTPAQVYLLAFETGAVGAIVVGDAHRIAVLLEGKEGFAVDLYSNGQPGTTWRAATFTRPLFCNI